MEPEDLYLRLLDSHMFTVFKEWQKTFRNFSSVERSTHKICKDQTQLNSEKIKIILEEQLLVSDKGPETPFSREDIQKAV